MEKGEKAKGRLVGEMRRWLSAGSERPRILAFSALGMEVPDNSGGAAHFPVRRQVCNEAASIEGPLQKEEKFTLLYFGSVKNKRKQQQEVKIATRQQKLFSKKTGYLILP